MVLSVFSLILRKYQCRNGSKFKINHISSSKAVSSCILIRYPVVLQKKLTDNANNALILRTFSFCSVDQTEVLFFLQSPRRISRSEIRRGLWRKKRTSVWSTEQKERSSQWSTHCLRYPSVFFAKLRGIYVVRFFLLKWAKKSSLDNTLSF